MFLTFSIMICIGELKYKSFIPHTVDGQSDISLAQRVIPKYSWQLVWQVPITRCAILSQSTPKIGIWYRQVCGPFKLNWGITCGGAHVSLASSTQLSRSIKVNFRFTAGMTSLCKFPQLCGIGTYSMSPCLCGINSSRHKRHFIYSLNSGPIEQ